MLKIGCVQDAWPCLQIRACLQALSEGRFFPAAVDLSSADFPRLDCDRQMEPIADAESLIECCLHYIEDPEDFTVTDRIIDGICRLGGEQPENFSAMSKPLLKRCRALLQKRRFAYENKHCADLCALIITWLASTPPPETHYVRSGNLWSELMKALVRKVRARQWGPLLSTPTHGLWLDARVLLERLQSQSEPVAADLALAFLRLAPDYDLSRGVPMA